MSSLSGGHALNTLTKQVRIAAVASLTLGTLAATPARAATEGVPLFDHQFVIMMENHSYSQIIGSPNTPYINQLASTYSLATNYFGTTHPSMPNYLSLIAGSNFGQGAPNNPPDFSDPSGGNDNPPLWSKGTPGTSATTTYDPNINSPSIVDQLSAKGLTWKTYQENLPSTGSNWANSTADGTSTGTVDKLYAVKHNPFAYFTSVQDNPAQAANMVGLGQLTTDLASGNAPNFAFIAPNQCNDMHGDPAGGCANGNAATVDAAEAALLKAGDDEVKRLVNDITSSSVWSKGNDVIYVLWDENDSGPESNQVPLISITNNGPRSYQDSQYGDHYVLLRTIEDGFGITVYLNNAVEAQPLTGLVAFVPEPSRPGR
jgi:hypothetical protein